MPRWLTGIIIGFLVICVACVAIVYLLKNRFDDNVSNEIAEIVATQVVASTNMNSTTLGQLVLTEDDLDINNVMSIDGSCGFQVTNQDTQIYGVTTEITPSGIRFECATVAYYSAVPVVENGRVELTNAEGSGGMMKIIFSKKRIENGVEDGINNALAAEGLKPISLTLENGEMTIITEQVGA